MSYLVTLVLCLFSLIKKKSKTVFIFVFLFMWIMFGWSYNNADYFSYISTFKNTNSNFFDSNIPVGLRFIFYLFNKVGLSYQIFLIMLSLIGILLISKAIIKYTNNINIVLFLYLLFPFVLDITQVKNFIVTVILTYSICYLASENKFSNIKFFILILVATTFHYASIIYLTLLLVKYFNRKKICIITIIFSIILVFIRNTSILLNVVSKIIPGEWVITRLYQGTDVLLNSIFLRYFRVSLIFIIYILISYSIKKYLMYKKQNNLNISDFKGLKEVEIKLKFIDIVTKINILLLITIPLMAYSQELYRIQQNILITNYIVLSMGFNSDRHNKVIQGFLLLLQVLSALFLLYFIVLRYNFDTVFLPAFKNNLLFK